MEEVSNDRLVGYWCEECSKTASNALLVLMRCCPFELSVSNLFIFSDVYFSTFSKLSFFQPFKLGFMH